MSKYYREDGSFDMPSYHRADWSSSSSSGFHGGMSSNSSYQSSGNHQLSTNAGYDSASYSNECQMSKSGGYFNNNNHVYLQSMTNYGGYINNTGLQNNDNYNNSIMSNQSINLWDNGSRTSHSNSNYSNNMGSNYNVSSYSNDGQMGHSHLTSMNQYNQFSQSGTGHNSLSMGLMDVVNKLNSSMGTNTNQKNVDAQKNKNMHIDRKEKKARSVKRLNDSKLVDYKTKKWIQEFFDKAKNIEDNKKTQCSEETNEDSKNSGNMSEMNNIPTEYLHCHMCNLSNFNSGREYLQHLESKNHAAVAHLHHAKCMKTLQLLRIDAKLANQRRIDDLEEKKIGKFGNGKKNMMTGITQCSQCQCSVPTFNEQKRRHELTPEHNLVVNYSSLRCCDTSFKNRVNIENHKLTIRHLRNVGENDKYRKGKKEKELEDIAALGLEDKSHIKQQVALNKKDRQIFNEYVAEEEVYTVSTLPHYDSQVAIGKKYLVVGTRKQCKVCSMVFDILDSDTHCRSSEHYENVIKFLKESKTFEVLKYLKGLQNKIDRPKTVNKKVNNITEKKITKEAENYNAHAESGERDVYSIKENEVNKEKEIDDNSEIDESEEDYDPMREIIDQEFEVKEDNEKEDN